MTYVNVKIYGICKSHCWHTQMKTQHLWDMWTRVRVPSVQLSCRCEWRGTLRRRHLRQSSYLLLSLQLCHFHDKWSFILRESNYQQTTTATATTTTTTAAQTLLLKFSIHYVVLHQLNWHPAIKHSPHGVHKPDSGFSNIHFNDFFPIIWPFLVL